jgi:hypothetical protein
MAGAGTPQRPTATGVMTMSTKEQTEALREIGLDPDSDEVNTRQRAAKPDFESDGFTKSVYSKFNGGKKPPAATGPEARIEDE